MTVSAIVNSLCEGKVARAKAWARSAGKRRVSAETSRRCAGGRGIDGENRTGKRENRGRERAYLAGTNLVLALGFLRYTQRGGR